jgi:hypothetical protein
MWISFAVNDWVRKVREDELYRRRNIAELFVVEVNILM